MIQILLVADDPGFRDRLVLALERLELSGEEVSFLEAANGNDALVLAEAHEPDLVVADVSVSPYGGFGLTRDLKANPEVSCPVILVLDRLQDEWLGRWSARMPWSTALSTRSPSPRWPASCSKRRKGEATLEERPTQHPRPLRVVPPRAPARPAPRAQRGLPLPLLRVRVRPLLRHHRPRGHRPPPGVPRRPGGPWLPVDDRRPPPDRPLAVVAPVRRPPGRAPARLTGVAGGDRRDGAHVGSAPRTGQRPS